MKIGLGMVAEVDPLGETRTVLQYILTPITRRSETHSSGSNQPTAKLVKAVA